MKAARCLPLCLLGLLLACSRAAETPPPPAVPEQVQARVQGEDQHLTVQLDGRAITAIVRLPAAAPGAVPVVVALHNFFGDAAGFAQLINGERLLQAGIALVLPQAVEGGEWQGPGLTITWPRHLRDGSRADDLRILEALVEAMLQRYPLDAGDITLLGFSQGATAALELARRMNARQPGRIRRVLLAAGGTAAVAGASLAVPGADLLHYEPGRNGPQWVADVMTGSPAVARWMPQALQAKGCRALPAGGDAGLHLAPHACADGRFLLRIEEAAGEHAWPGQPQRYDSALLGRGSLSRIDLTCLAAALVRHAVEDVVRRDAWGCPRGGTGW